MEQLELPLGVHYRVRVTAKVYCAYHTVEVEAINPEEAAALAESKRADGKLDGASEIVEDVDIDVYDENDNFLLSA